MELNTAQKRFWSGSGGENWANDRVIFDRRLQSLGDVALQKIDLLVSLWPVIVVTSTGFNPFSSSLIIVAP